ncbi:Arf-GAP with coiled-coil, ANK repeat and PH domain-containing protein 2 [Schistosoma haematobium]|uniref:Arf-GAP with coiled-coil, ANK repeat and PH domain-containing protein 2 n=1 Tax=Schistosoma haematobium TaxID=6185 RepID=A0A095AW56_SCHHA|nr:Arf-GAP with coiled-coil, ANK repeat and PH domain-containing protein 2 [Schistosoma haematobium]KAH9588299.1 Arf-GAP with coiled-coil, ANK repeat and PH domain-containing protein 2 [Schistosoma haematobium]
MSAGLESTQCFDETSAVLDDFVSKFASPLNKFGAFADSPELHQTLAHAELTICRIRAYYNLIQEICQQSVITGEAFSSSLFKLAKCIGLGLDQKQSWSFNSNLSREWNNFGTQKILNHATHLTSLFAEQTRRLATKISDIEHILSKNNDSLNKLHDLRTNFQRAYEHLDNLINRAASANSTRSPIDLQLFDNQVKEAQEIYQRTAIGYLSHLRQVIGPNYIISYMRLVILALSVQQSYSEQLGLLFNSSSKTNSLTSSIVVQQCKQLITSFEQKTNTEVPSKIKPSEAGAVEIKAIKNLNNPPNPRLEGYLFKRSGKKGWRTWSRRWFRVHENQLVYCKRFHGLTSTDLQSATDTVSMELNRRVCTSVSNTDHLTNGIVNKQPESGLLTQLLCQASPQWTIMVTDLRFCTARIAQPNKRLTAAEKPINLLNNSTDRRFVFEVISSGHRTYYLQAINVNELDIWVNTLRSGFHDLCQTSEPHYLKNGMVKENFVSNSLDLLTSRSPTQNSLDFSNSPTTSSVSGFPNGRTNDHLAQVSHSSISGQDVLNNKSGILLWREPDLSGNRYCADCSVGDARWASINLGVTLCTLCAAVHRSLGVHISKVRSLTLDNWQPELLHVMLNLGNKLVNEILESNWQRYASEFPRLSSDTPFEQRKAWVEAKWVHFKFARLSLPLEEKVSDSTEAVQWIKQLYDNWQETCAQIRQDFPELIYHPKSSSSLPSICISSSPDRKLTRHNIRRYTLLNELLNTIKTLYEKNKSSIKNGSRAHSRLTEQKIAANYLVSFGARLGCPLLILSGLTGGGSPDGKLKTDEMSTSSYPPLILASRIGSIAACEFLLLNGADIDIKDDRGRTALHHACQFGRVHLVCLLLRRRANQLISDNDGKSPLDVALQLANADIVTLLRLQRLNETAKKSDFTLNDETVDDVFRDFTSRTYYLNCDDNFDDDEVDDHNHEIANQNLESYNLSPLHCLPKPEITYTTNKVIKIRPNYGVSSSIPSSNSSTISSSTNTTNTTSTNITITSTPTTNREILIVTSPTNRDFTSPTGLSNGAVDIRRRRDKIKKRSDLSDKI